MVSVVGSPGEFNAYKETCYSTVPEGDSPRKGKVVSSSYEDFRPISLTSFILKTVEKLIDRYLRDTVIVELMIYRDQHAFMVGRFTETAL